MDIRLVKLSLGAVIKTPNLSAMKVSVHGIVWPSFSDSFGQLVSKWEPGDLENL